MGNQTTTLERTRQILNNGFFAIELIADRKAFRNTTLKILDYEPK